MKYLLIALLSLSFSSISVFAESSQRYVNGDYDERLKVIWLNNKKDNKKGNLQVKFVKALNNILNSNRISFNEKKLEKKEKYTDILSVMNDSAIYTDKEKLLEADMLSFIDDVNDQLIVVLRLEKSQDNNYHLYGLKIFKDEQSILASTYEVNKYLPNASIKEFENMIEFFIKSSINDYASVYHSASNPIITFDKNKKLQITLFKHQKIKRNLDPVESQDFELAANLGLISSSEVNQKTASEYCTMLGMMLQNKNFALDINDEYYFEELYEKFSFKDNWLVYKRNTDQDIKNKKIKCVGAKESLLTIAIEEYERNNIGLRLKLNDIDQSKEAIVAVDVQSSENFDGSNLIYSAIINKNGDLTFWENATLISKSNIYVPNPQYIKISENIDNITIKNYTKSLKFKIVNGKIEGGSAYDTEELKTDLDGVFINHRTDADGFSISALSSKKILINSTELNLPSIPTAIANLQKKLFLGGTDKLEAYDFNENGIIDFASKQEYKGISGDVSKILFFGESGNIVVGTTNSEILFYQKDKLDPFKIISSFGYSIIDMAISKNQKYLIVANADQTVYVFDLITIMNNVINNEKDAKGE